MIQKQITTSMKNANRMKENENGLNNNNSQIHAHGPSLIQFDPH
jgi:hypothetical protein